MRSASHGFETADRGPRVTDTPLEVLDCVGMQCPLPVVKTAQAIKKMPAGEVLEVLATDPGVEPDMNAWSRRTGNELISINREDDVFHVLIRKKK